MWAVEFETARWWLSSWYKRLGNPTVYRRYDKPAPDTMKKAIEPHTKNMTSRQVSQSHSTVIMDKQIPGVVNVFPWYFCLIIPDSPSFHNRSIAPIAPWSRRYTLVAFSFKHHSYVSRPYKFQSIPRSLRIRISVASTPLRLVERGIQDPPPDG